MGFRSARLAADKSAAEVAELMGVTRQCVWNWESGAGCPNAGKLLKLAEFLGCTVEDLLRDNPNRDGVR